MFIAPENVWESGNSVFINAKPIQGMGFLCLKVMFSVMKCYFDSYNE
jgi:hypothetical protein